MDVICVKNDGNSINNVPKKNKKRKNVELGGEELADEVPRKKMKSKDLGGMSDVVCGDGTEKGSRKQKNKEDTSRFDVNAKGITRVERERKKKKKDKSRIDVNVQEDDDNKREEKVVKDKIGDEREGKKKKNDKSRIDLSVQEDDDDKRVGKVVKDKIGDEGEGKKKKNDKSRIDVNVQEDDANKREEKVVKDKIGDEGEGKKKKNDTSRIDVNVQEDDANKREGKVVKDKTGDEGEMKKKEKDKSRIDVNVQEVDNEREGSIAKDKTGDVRERKKKKKDKSQKDEKAQEDDNKMENDKSEYVTERKKKRKDKSQIEVNAQENDNGREGKFAKDKVGDEGERKKKKKKDSEFTGADDRVGYSDANQIDNGVTNVELVEGRKRKKKKDRMGLEVSATTGGEDNENSIGKRKGKTIRSTIEKEVQADASEIGKVNGSFSHADSVENQMNDKATENIHSMKEKKKTKDNQGVDSLVKEPMKKRKENSVGSEVDRDVTGILKDNGRIDTAECSHPKKKSKKVKFSDDVEVFPHPDISSKKKKKKKEAVKDGDEAKESVKKSDDGLIRGKRFSKEEDEIIRNAVYKYIEDHQLGDKGLDMVLNCKSHSEIKNCWKEIGEALPQRPYIAVYNRAHILFERSEDRKWTPDEIEFIMTYVKKHGPKWKSLSVELGKHRFHVKDAWRRNNVPDLKRGSWSVEEYEKLFKLVNMDLSMKAYTEKKTKYGMLRDNICWDAISEELRTRSNSLCCMRWYNQLTSPMVAEGQWDNVDDYRLMIALNELDVACEEDVDWDNLLENRTGYICRKRWNQMVRHIGENGTKLFSEQVEILSGRYCLDLLNAREAYDNRPSVD